MDAEMEVLLAERAIQRVLTTCSRGVDRFDFEAVLRCYRPDGTDDHGSFAGGVDDFIGFVEKSLDRFERRRGEWRIKARVCAFDWRRTDRVDGEGGFADSYVRGLRSPEDVVHRILEEQPS